ncbi:MAG TPA: DUF2510 domain-containing protein [Candidatus Angelobacter sp.]|nr:DUF2510 domain-containing protein [Candidatus Angelobacter sp.]
MSPEAAWYADPTDPTAVRWWDGAQWTTQTRPAPRELALAGAVTATSGATAPAAESEAPTRSGPRHAVLSDDPAPASLAPAVPRHSAAPNSGSPDPASSDVDRSRPRPRTAAGPAPVPSPAPVDDPDTVDRSRPGARRPVVLPPEAMAPAPAPAAPLAAAPASFVPSVPTQAAAGHGFGAAPGGFSPAPGGFGAAPLGFGAPGGFGHDSGPVHPGVYVAPRSWKKPVAVLVVLLLALGGVAAYGVPKYLATRAQAVAAQQPDILVHTAPATLGGQKRFTVAGMNTTAIAASITGAGATWAWVQPYGNRNAVTIYLASDVPLAEQPTAVRALTSHDAATDLLATVSSGLSNGANGRLVTGSPVEYASPVSGKTWCMPVTVSGVQGGYCLWTSGKELLQTLSLPGLQDVAAKSTLDALTQMAKVATRPGASTAPAKTA